MATDRYLDLISGNGSKLSVALDGDGACVDIRGRSFSPDSPREAHIDLDAEQVGMLGRFLTGAEEVDEFFAGDLDGLEFDAEPDALPDVLANALAIEALTRALVYARAADEPTLALISIRDAIYVLAKQVSDA